MNEYIFWDWGEEVPVEDKEKEIEEGEENA